jgi:hypothetical protein
MVVLKKYFLDHAVTLNYLKTHLEGLNLLSNNILNLTPFNEGIFFTNLAEGVSKEAIHNFKNGCSKSDGIQKKAAALMQKQLSLLDVGLCIFDDYDQDYKQDSLWDLFNRVGVHYGKEMYYLVKGKRISTRLLLECFQAGDCIWHSLIVLSRTHFIEKKDKNITEDEMKQIAKTAQYVLLRAYDQEGYIIWEKRG